MKLKDWVLDEMASEALEDFLKEQGKDNAAEVCKYETMIFSLANEISEDVDSACAIFENVMNRLESDPSSPTRLEAEKLTYEIAVLHQLNAQEETMH